YRRELVDLRSKWPSLAWSRWAANAEAHGAGFAQVMRQIEVLPDPNRIDLDALDRFLRTSASDTLFAAFLMDAAAYVGLGFLEALGTRARYGWTSVKAQPMPVLFFDEVEAYVSPAAWIAKVWVTKAPTPLHSTAAQCAFDGSSPRSPNSEDVAIVRFRGNDLVPLGVQLANYPEVGPSFAQRHGPLTLETIAVAAKGQVLTPRLRQARPEVKDFLAPMDG